MVNIPFVEFEDTFFRHSRGLTTEEERLALIRASRERAQLAAAERAAKDGEVVVSVNPNPVIAQEPDPVNTATSTDDEAVIDVPIPITGIGGLRAPVDAYLSEEHDSSLELSKKTVESGSQAVTHAVRKPSIVKITGRILGPQALAAWHEIRAKQSRQELITVYTSLGTYTNMLIAGARSFIDDKTGYNLPFELDMEELIVVVGGGRDQGVVSGSEVIGPLLTDPENDPKKWPFIDELDPSQGTATPGAKTRTYRLITWDEYVRTRDRLVGDKPEEFFEELRELGIPPNPATIDAYRHLETDTQGFYLIGRNWYLVQKPIQAQPRDFGDGLWDQITGIAEWLVEDPQGAITEALTGGSRDAENRYEDYYGSRNTGATNTEVLSTVTATAEELAQGALRITDVAFDKAGDLIPWG